MAEIGFNVSLNMKPLRDPMQTVSANHLIFTAKLMKSQ
jgi:hypothetical protein